MNQTYLYSHKILSDEEYQRIKDQQLKQLNDHHTNDEDDGETKQQNIHYPNNTNINYDNNFNKQSQQQNKYLKQTQYQHNNNTLGSKMFLSQQEVNPINIQYSSHTAVQSGYYSPYKNTTTIFSDDVQDACLSCCCQILCEIGFHLCIAACSNN